MIKQRGFNDSQEINFCISFYFFQKLDLSVFVDLENFFIYAWIVMKFSLNDKAKVFSWYSGDCFCSYVWMSSTCSRSFPRGIASGGLHLLYSILVLCIKISKLYWNSLLILCRICTLQTKKDSQIMPCVSHH